MYLKYLIIVVFCKLVNGCLHSTFHNVSITVAGIRKPINTINGCFGPEKKLEKISLIQIINQTVPVLYEESFNNLGDLLDIILENDGIKEIKPGAFKNLPKIYLIRLRHNQITVIREGVFNNLSLSELNLVNNKIEYIETGALNNLPNLNILLLGNNRLTIWDPNWFVGSPKITTLNFENNFITKLPHKSFQNIHGIHLVNKLNISTSIHLNNNKIKEIEDGAFDGLDSLGWLFLQRNEINDFNADSLGSLKQLDWIRLENNKLTCIPAKLTKIAPNVKYYLDGNPLTEECVTRLEIKSKKNAFKITIN